MTWGRAVAAGLGGVTTFHGRAGRAEFWWYFLTVTVVALVLWVPYSAWMWNEVVPDLVALRVPEHELLSRGMLAEFAGGAFVIFAAIPTVVWLAPLLAALTRRLRDAGFSGRWVWLCAVGLWIVPVVLASADAEPFAEPGPPLA